MSEIQRNTQLDDDRLDRANRAIDAIAGGFKLLLAALLDRGPREPEQSPIVAEPLALVAAPVVEALGQPATPTNRKGNAKRILEARHPDQRIYFLKRRLPRGLPGCQRGVLESLDKIVQPMTRAEIGRQICVCDKSIKEAVAGLEQRGLIETLRTLPRTTYRAIEPTNEPTREANAC